VQKSCEGLIGWHLEIPELQHRSGQGISELRIHYGPGYRVYFIRRGDDFVLLLCGGDKSSQDSDIARAKKLASELED
jgi:putative addiction module killer protein